MLKNNKHNVSIAFKKNNDEYMKKTHLFMNKMYHQIIYGQDEADLLNGDKINRLKILETAWFFSEKNECLAKYDCEKEITQISTVESALKRHPVYNHDLFDYLCHDADIHDLKTFLLNDAVLNIEFFDYLTLAIIGVSDQAKAEIASNIWDEAGKGHVQKFHTTQFKKLLHQLGMEYNRKQIIDSMSWEGVAGINLFSYLAYHQYNKMKYFGLLAATELLDPPHYTKLIRGMKRIFNANDIDFSYYIEHEKIDIDHANGWLKNVVIPELAAHPQKCSEFWQGFYLRLDSALQYYDKLYTQFIKSKAA